GGVTFKSKQSVVAHHHATVVRYLKQLFAAAFNLYPDARGSGIQRIFEQLFQDRCRPFHHLSGGDLVGYVFGKDVDPAHELSLTTKGTKGHKITSLSCYQTFRQHNSILLCKSKEAQTSL